MIYLSKNQEIFYNFFEKNCLRFEQYIRTPFTDSYFTSSDLTMYTIYNRPRMEYNSHVWVGV